MSDIVEGWLSEATEERVPVEVCLDRALLGEYLELAGELADARQTAVGMMSEPQAIKDLAERVVELKSQVDAKTRRLVFTTISVDEWEQMKAQHRASDEVREKNRQQLEEMKEINPQMAALMSDLGLDHQAFSVATVTRCCIDPGLTASQTKRLRDKLPRGEWTRIWAACLRANHEGTQLPKFLSGIVENLASGLNSITPEAEESPSPSSADES